MKTLVALGTLREDITLNHDFSQPINAPEVKVHNAQWSIGGSVHNTCYYLSLKSTDLIIRMCTSNYKLLLQRFNQDALAEKYKIITTKTELQEHPISIIGLHKDGEKQLLSYNPVVDKELLLLFEHEAKNADFVYTSFYEINEKNYLGVCKTIQGCHCRGVMTMIDLCPLIGSINESILREVLNSIVIVSGNEFEYKELIRRLGITDMNDLLRTYPSINYLFIKRGNQGASYKSRYETEDYKFQYYDYNGLKAVNTTGCGDVFNAIIIEGFCLGKNSRSILNRAVIESGKIAKGGLPWIKQ